jgi:hypothetical protein
MTDEILVGVYDSHDDAKRAHAQLLEEGIGELQVLCRDDVATHAAPPHSDDAQGADATSSQDGGLAAFIGRMFSGAIPEDTRFARYRKALRADKVLIAVRARSDAQSNVAAAILTPSSPRVYPLPNAPTGWNEATTNDPASTASVNDPARPNGLLDDAQGLSAVADEARLSRSRAAPGGAEAKLERGTLHVAGGRVCSRESTVDSPRTTCRSAPCVPSSPVARR